MVVGSGVDAVVVGKVLVARVEQDGERWAQTRDLHHMY